jgi:hypothetical protein
MATLVVSYSSIQHQSNTNPDECFEAPVGGVYDGVNTAYVFVKAPKPETLKLTSKSSGTFTIGVDFTLQGKNLTILGSPLLDGDYLIADYRI